MALPTGVLGSWAVASLPAAFELLGAMAVLCLSKGISLKVQAALQNFSAGIIIAAIGGSLFPMLESKLKKSDSILVSVGGIVLGFAVALGLMFYIKSIGEDGPQYMQEDVDAADLDAAGEGFIGMDDDEDEDEESLFVSQSTPPPHPPTPHLD